MFDVIGVGCSAVDNLCVMDRFVEEDEKCEVHAIDVQGGGNIATALVAVARLGGSCCYHSVVGRDDLESRVLADLEKEGVDTAHAVLKEGTNPYTFILINRSNSSRTIIYTTTGVAVLEPDDLDPGLISSAKVLLVDLFHAEASLEAARVAREAGIPVVLDAELIKPLSKRVVEYATHLIPSRGFAVSFTRAGDDIDDRRLLDRLVEMTSADFVAITVGVKGAICHDRVKGETFTQDAFRVDTLDTTGAGDVFHGAFCYFLSRGCSLRDAVLYASGCSAVKCRGLGGRKNIPTAVELRDFLLSRGADVSSLI
jgi:sulfofructose kinase